MIQKINASWKIPADLLVRPYRIAATFKIALKNLKPEPAKRIKARRAA
jgi:hypothetical protein